MILEWTPEELAQAKDEQVIAVNHNRGLVNGGCFIPVSDIPEGGIAICTAAAVKANAVPQESGRLRFEIPDQEELCSKFPPVVLSSQPKRQRLLP